MRLKSIQISNDLIETVFTGGYEINHSIVKEGIPKGAELVNVNRSDFGREVVLTFRHDSFDEVPNDMMAPLIDCKVENIPPVEFSLKGLPKADRQALYEELHDVYNCRIFK